MASRFTSLLTSSHLDINVPLTPITDPVNISQVLTADSRPYLFFDENVLLYIVFRVPASTADASHMDEFLKAAMLNIEVAITDTPRQNDAGPKREKFEGVVVYSTTVTETSVKVREQVEEQWTRIPNPRVALTAVLSLDPESIVEEKHIDEIITADSWEFLSGQKNLLALLANDPNIHVEPVLPLSRIVSSAPAQTSRTKPGRRICRHIFPCGSPIDIRMRYTPIEPDDDSISAEIVLLSVDLSVTQHAGASVLVKEVKVEMGGGTITPLQELQSTLLRRYDVLTLLFRYERYGEDGVRKTVSIHATMVPLLTDSEETSPHITSQWNKVLDIPSLSPPLSQYVTPAQRAISQNLSPPGSARHSPNPSITGKPRNISAHGRTLTSLDSPIRPISVHSASEAPNLSITVQVPSKGVNPNEEFTVDIQVVNRANRPIKLALQVNSGPPRFRTQPRASRTDKLLPQVPMSPSLAPSADNTGNNNTTENEAREFFLRELELRKGKPIIALTVETMIGTLLPGQVQSTQAEYLALTPGIHEITGLRIVEIPTADTPPNHTLIINLTSCPSIVVHGDRY